LKIDFMSVDTEGYDLQVLKSNDWNVFKPKVICVESAVFANNNIYDEENNLSVYLANLGYKKVKDTKINSIYKLS
jgi:hypothetical protein